jgi:Apg6 BARA domain
MVLGGLITNVLTMMINDWLMTFNCLLLDYRINAVFESEIKRLDDECETMRETIYDEEARIDALERALHQSDRVDDGRPESLQQEIEHEAQLLRDAIQKHEEEIMQLVEIRKEQLVADKELNDLEQSIEGSKNSLYMEAKAFHNEQDRLSLSVSQSQCEIERLVSPNIRFISHLLELQIDKERGLRYPLINELRLAYRPKGDIYWSEIQVAWSLAAQLLLIVATIFEFRSHHYKIIPLANCAKLIYHQGGPDDSHKNYKVFNLGHPKSQGRQAMMAWNALLHAVCTHTEGQIKSASIDGLFVDTQIESLPYTMTASSIGGISLTHLQEDGDAEWSTVIQFMACNLNWLSECASLYALKEVVVNSALS